jgi:hypothetical protein
MGINRSACAIAHYLITVLHWDVLAVMHRLHETRKVALTNTAFRRQLAQIAIQHQALPMQPFAPALRYLTVLGDVSMSPHDKAFTILKLALEAGVKGGAFTMLIETGQADRLWNSLKRAMGTNRVFEGCTGEYATHFDVMRREVRVIVENCEKWEQLRGISEVLMDLRVGFEGGFTPGNIMTIIFSSQISIIFFLYQISHSTILHNSNINFYFLLTLISPCGSHFPYAWSGRCEQ